jgi:hypothetical protein
MASIFKGAEAPGMPIQLEFVHDGLGVIYRCEGTLGLQHFSVANDQLLAAPDRIRKLKYAVIDAAFDGTNILFTKSDGRHSVTGSPDCIIFCARIARCACPWRIVISGNHRARRQCYIALKTAEWNFCAPVLGEL